jgi:hypothetical protein
LSCSCAMCCSLVLCTARSKKSQDAHLYVHAYYIFMYTPQRLLSLRNELIHHFLRRLLRRISLPLARLLLASRFLQLLPSFLAKRQQLLSLSLCEHPRSLARSLALLQRMQRLFNDAERVALERFRSLCCLVVGSEGVLRQYLYFCTIKAGNLSRTSRAQEACSASGPVLYALMLAAPPFAAKAAKRDDGDYVT